MLEATTDLSESALLEPIENVHGRKPLERTNAHSLVAMGVELAWRCENARHTDRLFLLKLNLWRDLFPPEMAGDVMGQPVGHRASRVFPPGQLLVAWPRQAPLSVSSGAFNRRFRRHAFVEPRAGRFYPKGFIAGVQGIFPEEVTPFRICEVGERLCVDLNHPMSQREIEFRFSIMDIWDAGDEHGGRCNDVADLAAENGPGMQARWHDRPTDFWSDIPFMRSAPGQDGDFYREARLVDHIDATATAQVERLYGSLIPRGSRILDLMASWKSHLPDELFPEHVVGLGMNQEELEANPLLSQRLVHDLNQQPGLPFDDKSFDAVVCTVSVEYLTRPLEVFAEVKRVLKRGGRFIVTFSNRWFPPKVVKVWQDIHEFERMGLVLEYFLKSGGFNELETLSSRGLPRPEDDKYAHRLMYSDPVYAVWGCRD